MEFSKFLIEQVNVAFMSDFMAPPSIEVITSLKEVSEKEWNNCNSEENPFTSYAFLRALEESGQQHKILVGSLSILF